MRIYFVLIVFILIETTCIKVELVVLNIILIKNFKIQFNPSNDTTNLITVRRSMLNKFVLLLKSML